MTKLELTELIRNDMFEALKTRERIDPMQSDESFGYYNGQYRAYENVLKILTMFEIEELSSTDTRLIRQ